MKKIRAYSGRIAFLYILSLFVLVSFIYALVSSIIKGEKHYAVFFVIISPVVLYSLFKEFKPLFKNVIVITDEYIYMGDIIPAEKHRQIQYETKIFFKDIVSVDLVSSLKNSKNKVVHSIDSVTNKKYLEFVLLNGQKERLWINGYTKKQTTAVLTFLSTKVDFKLNVDEIMKYWYLTFGQYKKMKELRKKEGKPWE